MKLSEMTTGQAADAMVLLAEPVANIASDAKITSALNAYSKAQKSGKTVAETFGVTVGKIAPALLQSHRTDVYAIISAMTGKTPEEINQQKIMQTVADIKELWDGDMQAFFKSAATTE